MSPRASFLLGCGASLLLLVGCAAAVDVKVQCLPMAEYTPGVQSQIQAAYDDLPQSSILRGVIQDYLALRDANRACEASSP